MIKEIKFNDLSRELLEQLQKGAFLTVREGSRVNTMTIAWGSIGYMWNIPVFIAMVRYSRYTYELIEKSGDFTVSLPLHGQLKKELAFCGSRSGRDMDKIGRSGITLKDSMETESPVIEGCDLFLECRIVYKQGMDQNNLDGMIKDKSYADGDYHVMYFGEIVKAYIREE